MFVFDTSSVRNLAYLQKALGFLLLWVLCKDTEIARFSILARYFSDRKKRNFFLNNPGKL